MKFFYSRIEKDEVSSAHKISVDAYLIAKSSASITNLIDDKKQKDVELRRQIVSRIIQVIIFLAKQDLAFRSHRNEGASAFRTENENKGNFLATIELIAKFDPILENYVQEISKKSLRNKNRREEREQQGKYGSGRGKFITFLSNNTFNKILYIICRLIQVRIADEIKRASMFSLQIDSTQDVAVVDQLSICVRYVFDGKASLEELGLDMSNLVSQSYDGASNMSGEYNGLQTQFKIDSPDVVFTHCHAHVLNLLIQDITNCCVASQDLFSLLNTTSVFMARSFRRANLWKDLLKKEKGNEKLRKLKKISETRWNSKDAALTAVFHSAAEPNSSRYRFIYLLEALHLGYSNTTDAFLFLEIFTYATPLSKYLQTKGLDFLAAWHQIKSLKSNTDGIRNNFNTIYEKSLDFCKTDHLEKLDMQQDFAETRVRRKKKMPDELCEDESADWTQQVRYKVDTFTLILDRLSTDFNERFLKNEWLLKVLVLLDPKRFDEINSNLVEFREPFSKLCYLAKCEEVQKKRFLKLLEIKILKKNLQEKVHEYHIESEDDDEKCVKN
ncbi:hypothetical protein JTB14_006728 [Gonioctena quinquepunctata]|nr:hypothetical protein JTB14_006728 [Gonioctena quinquepunctata]